MKAMGRRKGLLAWRKLAPLLFAAAASGHVDVPRGVGGHRSIDPREAQRLALEQWQATLADREARIKRREEELGMTVVGGVGAANRFRPVDAVEGAAAEVLVFEDTFEDLDLDVWVHDITMAGGGNWEFQLYTNNRTNSFVEDGVLYLQPTLTEDTIGEDNLMGRKPFRFDMWGMWPSDKCTSNAFYGCERMSDMGQHLIINPVQSARLITTGTFTFKYGRLEVEAKLPKGDWLWPAIWLLPEKNRYGQWPASGEIDVMESRGNKPGYPKGGYDSYGSCMHWGPFFGLDPYELTCKGYTLKSGTFNDDFHTFGLYWDETQLYTYLDTDDQRVLEVKFDQSFWDRGSFDEYPGITNPWKGRPNSAPFDQPFYIILNVAVGGLSAFFEDGVENKPWSSTDRDSAYKFMMAKEDWYPTWSGRDSALQVKSVRVWQQRHGSATATHKQTTQTSPAAVPTGGGGYNPASRSQAQPGAKPGGSSVGWALGSVFMLALIGGGIVFGLYLKFGGWRNWSLTGLGWGGAGYNAMDSARSTSSSGVRGGRVAPGSLYQAVPSTSATPTSVTHAS